MTFTFSESEGFYQMLSEDNFDMITTFPSNRVKTLANEKVKIITFDGDRRQCETRTRLLHCGIEGLLNSCKALLVLGATQPNHDELMKSQLLFRPDISKLFFAVGDYRRRNRPDYTDLRAIRTELASAAWQRTRTSLADLCIAMGGLRLHVFVYIEIAQWLDRRLSWGMLEQQRLLVQLVLDTQRNRK